MNNYNKALEARKSLQECLTIFSDMLGNRSNDKQSIYGFTPGLDMTSEVEGLEERQRKLSEGVFQVMFTGGFSAGKSTLLNALIRKNLLRTSINPETAVITKIIFQQAETVIIYYKKIDKNGEKITETLSTEEFFERFRVSQDDPRMFEDVEYVIIKQTDDGIAGGLVQLVDSPGTENSEADTKASRDFLQKADAIVHLINSTMAFQEDDKAYIADHYANKHMKNLFFVCNRFDNLNKKERADLKERVRKELELVFQDENGIFDEELFESRVFYTDAYHALAARCPSFAEDVGIETDIDEDATNVPQFEAALGAYLNDEDRDTEAFKSYLNQLAVKYVRAKETILDQLECMDDGVDSMKADLEDLESKKERLDLLLTNLKNSCESCLRSMIESATGSYDKAIQRIDAGWEAHFSDVKIKFNILDMLKLAHSQRKNDKAKLEKLMKPFQDSIKEYITEEMRSSGNEMAIAFEGHLNTLEAQMQMIELQIEELHLPLSFESIRQALKDALDNENEIDIEEGTLKEANMFQLFLGLVGGDIEGMVEGLAGNQTNKDAITKFIVRNVIDVVAINVVAWPIGLAILAFRFVGAINSANEANKTRASEILNSMRDGVIPGLKQEKEKYTMEVENILSPILRAGNEGVSLIRGKVSDYETSRKILIDNMEQSQCSYNSEKERTDSITRKMLSSLGEVYTIITGQPVTEKQVYAMAGTAYPAE